MIDARLRTLLHEQLDAFLDDLTPEKAESILNVARLYQAKLRFAEDIGMVLGALYPPESLSAVATPES